MGAVISVITMRARHADIMNNNNNKNQFSIITVSRT